MDVLNHFVLIQSPDQNPLTRLKSTNTYLILIWFITLMACILLQQLTWMLHSDSNLRRFSSSSPVIDWPVWLGECSGHRRSKRRPGLARALAFKFHRHGRLARGSESSDANQPEWQHFKMQVTLSASALARVYQYVPPGSGVQDSRWRRCPSSGFLPHTIS